MAEQKGRGNNLGKRKNYTLRMPIHLSEQLEEMAGFYGVPVSSLIQMMIGQSLRTADKLVDGFTKRLDLEETKSFLEEAIKKGLQPSSLDTEEKRGQA